MDLEAKKWDFDQYNWIHDYDNRMRNTKHLRYDETLSRVLEKASIQDGDLVLDIGTGTGNLAVSFLERGCQVFGLDPSPKLLEIAEQKVKEWQGHFHTRLCEEPFLKIPFPEQTFDAVVSTFSIHHISDESKQLSTKEMKRVLKPNGRIIIGDVMFQDEEDKTRAFNEYTDMEDEYQPMLDAFPKMFDDEGFSTEVEQVADTVWIVCARLK